MHYDNRLNQQKKPPFVREGTQTVVFDPQILEVSIIDRSGRAIWRKTATDAPIRWTGIDAQGQTIRSGDYLCKLVYPDEKVSYMPFVFVTHAK